MESPGEFLKRERELRGADLPHIADCTRVPLVQLEALEGDDYEKLPHSVYVRGFIRAYCKCLGLDESDAVLRYEAYMKEHAADSDDIEALDEIIVTPAAVTALLVVAGVLAILVFFFYRGDAPTGSVAVKTDTSAVEAGAEEPAAAVEAVVKAGISTGAAPEEGAEVGGRHALSVLALNDTWMRVSIDDGDPFEVMLESGDTVRWKGDEVFFYS